MSDIDPNRAIEYIQLNAGEFAEAKGNRIYIENHLRVTKGRLMNLEDGTLGNREAFAYAHPDYEAELRGLQAATEKEERLQWMLKAAMAKIEIFKTIEYTKRQELKNL